MFLLADWLPCSTALVFNKKPCASVNSLNCNFFDKWFAVPARSHSIEVLLLKFFLAHVVEIWNRSKVLMII